MSAPTIRRRPKGQRARRWRWNKKEPAGRLRERKIELEALIDNDRFDPTLSASLDRVIIALEARA
jgi:hypothetical protein